MSDTYFEILRPGINSTIQDKGRNHLYHIGITISGAMDQRIFVLSNALVNNDLNEGTLNLLSRSFIKTKKWKCKFCYHWKCNFNILRKNSVIEEGKCFQNYLLEQRRSDRYNFYKKFCFWLFSGRRWF